MVSFVCNSCQETIKKPKLDQHKSRCRNASFCCIDCGMDFEGASYRQHTSCMTEAEKYEGKAKGKKANSNGKNNTANGQQNKPQQQQGQKQHAGEKRKSSQQQNGSKKAKADCTGSEIKANGAETHKAALAKAILDVLEKEKSGLSYDSLRKKAVKKAVKSQPNGGDAEKEEFKKTFDELTFTLKDGKAMLEL